MDVTRSNFQELLPAINDAISESDFICIDGEFTGLRTGRAVNAFDSPSEYYKNVMLSSSDFLLVQFGLCAFRWDADSQIFRQSAFNFYLFPRAQHRFDTNRIFSCQSSSIEFLAEQKFDFNKLFYEGISYLSTPEEIRMREALVEKNNHDRSLLTSNGSELKSEPPIPIPVEHSALIEDICQQVDSFIKDGSESLQFDNLNPFIRKLVYQELEIRFKNKLFIETLNKNQKRILSVSKALTKEEKASKVENQIRKEWEDMEAAVGFSQVIRKISKSGKLVVGHCLLLDFLHILSHFFSPLPESYEEFKEFAHSTFPRILDTMYLASLPEFKEFITQLNLNNLSTRMSEDPFKIPPIEPEVSDTLKGYSLKDSKFHEAGYDAFTTGVCFLSLFEFLARSQHLTVSKATPNAQSHIIKPFINKIFLFKTSPQGHPYINLAGKDLNPSRDHVLHMVFPAEWSRNEIYELFSPFGGVFVSFIDETSAFIALRRRDQMNFVLSRLGRHNAKFTLTPFLTYKAAQKSMQIKFGEARPDPPDRQIPTKRRAPAPGDSDGKLTTEDLGEPISRESCPASESDKKRKRRTSGGSGEEAVPRRRRTSSGLFKVTEAETDLTKPKEKRSFNENDDWN